MESSLRVFLWHDNMKIDTNIYLEWAVEGAIPNPHAKVFDPSSTPKSHSWGMTPATEWKFCSICFLSFICKNAHKVWYKNLRIDMAVKICLTFWPHPKVSSLTLGCKFYLHSVLLVILIDLICHMTMFEKRIVIMTPWAPQSPTPGAWPRRQNKNPVWYVLYLSFVRAHKVWYKKSLKLTL